MPTVRELLNSDFFNGRPLEERIKILSDVDKSQFAKFPKSRQIKILTQAEKRFRELSSLRAPNQELGAWQQFTQGLERGWQAGKAELARSAAGFVSLVPGEPPKKIVRELHAYQAKTAPPPTAEGGLASTIGEVVGSAPAQIIKYAPAVATKRWAPLVAGAIGAVSESEGGPKAMAEAGVKDIATFWLLDKAGRLPKRTARIAASASVSAAPTAIETGDIKKTATAAVMGGAFGAVSPKPKATEALTPQQVTAIAKGGVEAFNAFKNDFLAFIAPQEVSGTAKEMASIMRSRTARIYRSADIANYAAKEARKYLDKLDFIDQIEFINAIEGGLGRSKVMPKYPKPMVEAAQTLTKILDEKATLFESVSGKTISFYENYFPHFFTNPTKAKEFVEGWYAGKRPLRGPAGFLKQRKHPTLADAMEYGLEPVVKNPVDWVLLKSREIDRYVAAQWVLQDAKAAKIAKFVPYNMNPPVGYRFVNDPAFRVRGKGQYAIPEQAARVVNNYLSPGLRGKPTFDFLMASHNFINQAQLSMSAFHLTFTSVDAATSKMSIGIEKLVHGIRTKNPSLIAKSVATMAEVPIAPVSNAIKGYNILEEWRSPGSSGNPQFSRLAALVEEAGGRVAVDPIYVNRSIEKFRQALRDNKPLKASFEAIPALIEWVAKPIMQYIVPYQKLGVFADMAEFELSRLPANAPLNQVREVFGRAWDSADNRMGQIVYDNLFWPRWFKDLSMFTVRSVGWNLGTIREIAGGAIDSVQALKNVLRGQPWEFTHRMAYLTALPLVTGTIGGMLHYAMNYGTPNQIPQGQDWFFPRTGRRDEFGKEERIAIPSYIKDIYHYYTNPVRTVTYKLSPLLWTVAGMLSNEDFYKTEIRNADDPLVKQVADLGIYVVGNLLPMSIRAAKREAELDYPIAERIMAFFGFLPAPSDITRSDAEKEISKYFDEHPIKHRTKEEYKRKEAIKEIERAIRLGHDVAPLIDRAIAEKKIIPADIKTVVQRASTDPLVRGIKYVSLPVAIRVYEKATPAERERIHDAFVSKVKNNIDKLITMPEKRQRDLAKKIVDLLGPEALAASPSLRSSTSTPPEE